MAGCCVIRVVNMGLIPVSLYGRQKLNQLEDIYMKSVALLAVRVHGINACTQQPAVLGLVWLIGFKLLRMRVYSMSLGSTLV